MLEFDHRPGEKKEYALSKVGHITIKKLAIEIAKCDVRCANCHRKMTFARRQLRKAGILL